MFNSILTMHFKTAESIKLICWMVIKVDPTRAFGRLDYKQINIMTSFYFTPYQAFLLSHSLLTL